MDDPKLECKPHEWEAKDAADLGNFTTVKCAKCGMCGELDEKTGDIYYPAT